jgi:hypothetical protein
MDVLKRKDFARWQAGERLPDEALCKAVKDKANITPDEKRALQFAGGVFLDLSLPGLTKAIQAGVLMEVHCVDQAH